MFDKSKYSEALAVYKDHFVERQIRGERYKWEAVKCFQDNWNVNAEDFAKMLEKSLSLTDNLLAAANFFPRQAIIDFAKASSEEVRAMFITLYDENTDLADRVAAFKEKTDGLHKKYGDEGKKHFQTENAIMTYLWLRYPDKYYIYKFTICEELSKTLGSNYQFGSGKYTENIRNFMAFYDELSEELRKDPELRELLGSQITSECYDDPQLHTLTIDFGFYIGSGDYEKDCLSNGTPAFWKISHGNDCISDADFDVFENRNVIVVHKDTAAKAKASVPQGEAFMSKMKKGDFFYLCRGNSIRLLGRIDSDEVVENPEKKDGWCERHYSVIAMSGDTSAYTGTQKWWTPNDNSTCIAVPEGELEMFNECILKPYFNTTTGALLNGNASEPHYLFLIGNPQMWDMTSLPVGESVFYTLRSKEGNKRRIYQSFLDAKVGDLVIGYESGRVKKITSLLHVSKEQDGEKIYFVKDETLLSPIDYHVLADSSELKAANFDIRNAQGSLFSLTKEAYDYLMSVIREENPVEHIEKGKEKYTKEDFLREVYMDDKEYDRLASVLSRKKNIILQGAPGVGKTFAAKRLAYSLMGEKDDERVEFVQFHQNYSYEDFVMGYKPIESGFELKYGIFYRFCQKAANHPDKDYFFIIDEINRGNMSKIFGELLMLIENDHRGDKVTLAYNGLSFSVPEKLHIIGMMNTADRSLAMIDYALRRRFSFFDIAPGFNTDGFKKYQSGLNNETFNALIEKIVELNEEIESDKSLGKGFRIGHSYFCNATECTEDWMREIIDFDIVPMLTEYWFDDEEKVARWNKILQDVIDD